MTVILACPNAFQAVDVLGLLAEAHANAWRRSCTESQACTMPLPCNLMTSIRNLSAIVPGKGHSAGWLPWPTRRWVRSGPCPWSWSFIWCPVWLMCARGSQWLRTGWKCGGHIDRILHAPSSTSPCRQWMGKETLRDMRLIDPRVKVLLSSKYNEQVMIQQFVGQGFAGFMAKPYLFSTL